MSAPPFGNPIRGLIGPYGGAPDPDSGFRVTRPYADESMPQYGPHDGLDIGNGQSGADILAMADGEVYQAFFDAASGGAGIVRIDHGGGWTTGYAHMSTIRVSAGQRVAKGAHIADLDTTGWATGAHLHYDVTEGGRRRDPWPYCNADSGGWPAMLFRPVQQDWYTGTGEAGGAFYTDGPGVGAAKWFTSRERVTSIAEGAEADGTVLPWREVRYGGEILWMHRDMLDPIDGTRDPPGGYGPPMGADSEDGGPILKPGHLRGSYHLDIRKVSAGDIEFTAHLQEETPGIEAD
jgi:murein DD-endopeptidase MepM/ murein hydrolase activator NlpD